MLEAWLLRATALCLVAAVVAAAMQRRSADAAHRVWIAALAGVASLPLFAAVVPTWAVASRVMPPVVAVDREPVTPIEPPALSLPELPAAAMPATPTLVEPLPMIATNPPAPDAAALPQPTFHIDWPLTIALTWAGVAAALVVRLIGAAVLLTRTVRRAPAASDELRAWVAGVATALGVRRRFDVRTLPAGSMPMACWLGRWVVLLPADIPAWPEPLRWTVAAHELGHVARRDAWTDLIAQFVCRLGWPHPLLWLAARSVPRLRERACDEWVLATGHVDPRAYANHLLDVVVRCTRPGVALAPAMARAADLERRVRRVLAGPRMPRPWLAHAATVGGIVLTAVIAGAQPPVDAKGTAVQRTAEPVATDGPTIRIAGVVVTPDGQPVGGATVVLRAKTGGRFYAMGVKHNRDVLARTTADAAGRFTFDGIGIPPRLEEIIESLIRGQGGAELLAWADGRALAWTDVKGLTNAERVRLALPAESPVTGVVRDATGKGVPGARVHVSGATRATADADAFMQQPGDVNFVSSEVTAWDATTDAAGRFALHHLPPDYRFHVGIRGDGLAWKSAYIDTAATAGATEMRVSGGGGGTYPVLRSPLSVDLKPQRFVTVKVLDHAGRPVTDGGVQAIDSQRHGAGQDEMNARGECRIAAREPGRYQFIYGADPLNPRVGSSTSADIAAGTDSPVVEIRLPEPTWLTGRVVDADTGKGVAGAYVSFAQKISDGPHAMAVSGPGGEFRIPTVPGRGMLSVVRPVFGYHAPYLQYLRAEKPTPGLAIDIPQSGEPAAVTLPLPRGLGIRGMVRDAAGKAVAGAAVQLQNDDSPYRKAATTTDKDGRFVVAGVAPHVKSIVTVQAGGGAAQAVVDAAPDQPWDKTRWQDVELTLEPGVTLVGRVLHKGQPVAGVTMKLMKSSGPVAIGPGSGGTRFSECAEATTDALGRYRVSGLKAGDNYYFIITAPNGMADPDWHHQMPYSQAVREGKAEIALPDVNLTTRGQSLRGVVVDPKGKPVAGVTVNARLVSGQNLSRRNSGPPPWTTTDAQGRFALTQLPDQPLELMIWKAGPGGTRIRFPAVVKTTTNQQDVRAVYDPTLADEVEDLDAPKKP
ncbi:MAG: carboxypeptidase regulatory-like domain-containing protein [Gemmataceae bacterium]